MNWIGVCIVLGIALFLYGLTRNYSHGDGWMLGGVIILAIGVVAGLGAWYAVTWEFKADMAAATEIRSATEVLGCDASEDVIGKAAEFNSKVARARVENQRWLDDPFVNDGIDTVTMIVIPTCK